MTSLAAVYPLYLDALFNGYDPSSGTPTIQAYASDYAYDPLHEFLSDVSGTAIGDPIALTTVVSTGGIMTADDPAITSTVLADTITGLIVFDDTGTPATSRLWCFIDRKSDGSALSFVSPGGTVTVQLPSGRLFSI